MDCKDEQGWTEPLLVVENEHERVMQQQLERRADLNVNCKRKRSWTVLRPRLWQKVKMLLEKGANAHSKDHCSQL
jgi:hypothetical protein